MDWQSIATVIIIISFIFILIKGFIYLNRDKYTDEEYYDKLMFKKESIADRYEEDRRGNNAPTMPRMPKAPTPPPPPEKPPVIEIGFRFQDGEKRPFDKDLSFYEVMSLGQLKVINMYKDDCVCLGCDLLGNITDKWYKHFTVQEIIKMVEAKR